MLSTPSACVGVLPSGTSTYRLRSRAAPSGCGDAPSSERRWALELKGETEHEGRAGPPLQT
eukprot:2314282-Pyramimonas_sp.AAC.1